MHLYESRWTSNSCFLQHKSSLFVLHLKQKSNWRFFLRQINVYVITLWYLTRLYSACLVFRWRKVAPTTWYFFGITSAKVITNCDTADCWLFWEKCYYHSRLVLTELIFPIFSAFNQSLILLYSASYLKLKLFLMPRNKNAIPLISSIVSLCVVSFMQNHYTEAAITNFTTSIRSSQHNPVS